jgi:hypothetical protein
MALSLGCPQSFFLAIHQIKDGSTLISIITGYGAVQNYSLSFNPSSLSDKSDLSDKADPLIPIDVPGFSQ